MTARTAALRGAALLTLGGLAVLTAAASPPVSGLARTSGLLAYLGLGGLVLYAGLRTYGPAGGLGALALTAFSAPVLSAAGSGPLAVPLTALATAAVLMRCLLDPTLLRAALAGVLMAAGVLAACDGGQSPAGALIWPALYSSLLAGLRYLTAEAHEPSRRVLQAAAVAVATAWIAAALLLGLYTVLMPGRFFAGPAGGVVLSDGSAEQAALYISLALLIGLAAGRPWRRQRRYADGSWVLALVCLGLPSWWVARRQLGCLALAAVVPFLAVLAGAWWGGGSSAGRCRVATAAAVLHALLALLLLGALAANGSGATAGPEPPRRGVIV